MKLLHTRIQGFGPYHRALSVAWPERAQVVALVAPFGTGKSFLLDSLMAALYGEFPSYPGRSSMKDTLSLDGDGTGEIEVRFEHEGLSYRAFRRVTASTHTASLFVERDGTEVQVAGPALKDFDPQVLARFGSKDLALSTWYFAQSGKGDLVDALPSERRAVLGQVLGFEELNALSVRFGDEVKKAEGVRDHLRAELAVAGDPSESIAAAEAALARAREDAKTAKAKLDALNAEAEGYRAQLREATGGDNEQRAAIERHEAAVKALADADGRVRRLTEELRDAEARAAGLARAKEDEAALALCQKEAAELEAEEAQARVYHRWEVGVGRAESELTVALANADKMRASASLAPADRELAERLPEIEGRYRAAREDNDARAGRNTDRAKTRERLARESSRISSRIADINARMQRRPETPFGDECGTKGGGCAFLAEFAALPKDLEAAKAELARIDAELSAVPADEPLSDLTELIGEGRSAREAAGRVASAQSAASAIASAEAEVERATAALESARNAKPAEPARPLPEIEQALRMARRRAGELGGAPERVLQATNAAARATALDAQVAAVNAEAEAQRAETQRLDELAASARQVLVDKRRAEDNLKAQIAYVEGQIATVGATRDGAIRAEAEASARIAAAKEALAKIEGRRAELAAIEDRIAGLDDLRLCFGPRGVQPIIIDTAMPDVERRANGYLDTATGGRMSLRVPTQRANKSGAIVEDLFIEVGDQRGWREAKHFSGGEKRLIRTALRLAVTEWAAGLHGRAATAYYADEALDNLGVEGAPAMARLLADAGKRREQVIVIAHDDQVLGSVASTVRLIATPAGVQVAGAGRKAVA